MSSDGVSEGKVRRWALPVRAGVFFAGWLACYALSIKLRFVPCSIVAFWPPGGLMLGALLVAGPGEWIAFLLAAMAATVLYETGFGHQTPLVLSLIHI